MPLPMIRTLGTCLGAALLLAASASVADHTLLAPDAVLSRDELGTYDTSLYGVMEALALRAGITFHATGDMASEDWVLVRGWPRDSSRNVLVLLDDMPTNNAATGSVELHDVPLEMVERVEVYKPPLPAPWGGYHAVIRFVTAPPPAGRGFRAQATTGPFDTQIGSLSAAGAAGSARVGVELDMVSSDNLTGQQRTPPLESLAYGERSYRDFSPSLRLDWPLTEDTRLRLVTLGSKGRKAFSDDEYRNRWFLTSGAALAHRLGAGQVTATAYASYEDFFLRLLMHPDISHQERLRLGGRVDGRFPLLRGQTLSAGAAAHRSRVDDPARARRSAVWSGWVEDHVAVLPRLSISAGVHYDGSQAHPAEISPSAAVEAHPWPGGRALVRWSRAVRTPPLDEIPLQADVDPEVLTGWTAGVRQGVWGGALDLGATWFDLDLEGELGIDPATGEYRNQDAASHSRGLELEARTAVASRLDLLATYTFTDLTRDGGGAAYGPSEHTAGASALFHDEGKILRLSARYLGTKTGVYRQMGAPTVVADALVVDLYYSRAVAEGLRAFVNCSNLFDVRYETFQGRPMFRRTLLLGLELGSL